MKWGKLVLSYLKLISALSIFIVFLVLTGGAKAVEPIAPPLLIILTTTDIRTDKDLFAHLGNLRTVTMPNGNGTEEDNTETRLKHSVIESKILSHAASSSIASFFEEYFSSTPPSNNNTMADDNPFSTSMLFETLSILPRLTTYPNNNLIDLDLSSILGLGNRRISVELGGQLPSSLQIPVGRLQDNSLNPIGYFFAFTIRF